MPDFRAALYVRVSTDEQALEGYSLSAQKSILREYCIAEDWVITECYIDDGYSGTNALRPAYKKMMSEMDEWDVMLVLKMDRIHRNSRNFMTMMETLDKNGKKFVSCMESLDTTNAMGRFVVDMIQRLAQLESEQIGERTYDGMREKAETLENSEGNNRTMGFNPPFGYVLSEGMLYSVPGELDTVRRIYSMYADGATIDHIAYTLNGEGTLTKRGNPWNVYNLRNILHNPIYAGYMRWDDAMIKHYSSSPVSPDLFNRVQELMASKVRDPKKRAVRKVPEDDF